MNEVEIIKGAREILSDPNRWHKGALENVDRSAMCILGAADKACEGHWDARYIAEDLLEEHLPGGVEAFKGRKLVPIAAFNDDPLTTHEDVLTLLDKTLAALGALGDDA